MTDLTSADLDQIEQRAAAATAGVWHEELIADDRGDRVPTVVRGDGYPIAQAWSPNALPGDITHIIDAHNNQPRLIAALRAAWARIDALEDDVDELHDRVGQLSMGDSW